MYDLIIIGGSAAGASAGIYAARRGLKFRIIAKDLGGEVALSGDVDNWLGVPHTTGTDLSLQFAAHLKTYSPDLLEGYLVTAVTRRDDGSFAVTTDDGAVHEAKAVIVASGVHSRELGVPGEKEYRLRGVSYCTVCDGPLYKGREVITVGGGNSALESALMMADLSPKVTVINKNPAFKGEAVLMEKLKAKPNVQVVYSAATTAITGDGSRATGLSYKDEKGAEHSVSADGIFVHIGQIPNSQMVTDAKKDAFGYLETDANQATSVPGLFAAGDVTNGAHKQIIIAAGQGAAAALSAVSYLNKLA